MSAAAAFARGTALGRAATRVAAVAGFLLAATTARAEPARLPAPLGVAQVAELARSGRAEVDAALAAARAAAFRPAIVSALDDPMITASIDHLPFDSPVMVDSVNRSVMVEQAFPLSHVRAHRQRAAEAAARRARADADRVALDVELDAVAALLMVHEMRRTRAIVEGQVEIARQLVSAATARYGTGQAGRPEVLRAETELARLTAEDRALAAEAAAAEAMLLAALGLPVGESVPELAIAVDLAEPPPLGATRRRAQVRRPELVGMRADIDRARAEVDVMRSMYGPMARVGVGTAYTMTDGPGAMFLVGVSIPLWRGRLSAGVSEAESMERMTRAELAAMRRMVDGQVAQAHEQVRAQILRVRALRDEVLPRARQAVESALTSYGAAQVPMVVVLDATGAQRDAELDLVRAEVALELARANLRRATAAER